MILEEIKSEAEYEKMLYWVDEQLDINPDLHTPEGMQLQKALFSIKAYEDINYPIPFPIQKLVT